MSHVISPTPANPSGVSVSVPDPGDNRTAASVEIPFTSIWSGVLWLYGLLSGTQARNVTIDGGLSATGQISAGTDVSVANDIRCYGRVNANGDLAVAGNAGINGATTMTGALDVNGAYFDCSGVSDQAYLPKTTFYGALDFGSGGRVVSKTAELIASVGMTISPLNTSFIRYTAAAGGSTATIDDTGCMIGDWIEIVNESPTNLVTIKAPGGAITLAAIRSSAGGLRGVKLVKFASGWHTTFLNYGS